MFETNALLDKYKDDPKFCEYLRLTIGNADALEKAKLKDKRDVKDSSDADGDKTDSDGVEGVHDESKLNNAAINQDLSNVKVRHLFAFMISKLKNNILYEVILDGKIN